MDIHTKFNINDTVYIFRHKSIFVTQIKNIKIRCYKDSYHVDYSIFDKEYLPDEVIISEDEIFATEDECRKSIPIKKNN